MGDDFSRIGKSNRMTEESLIYRLRKRAEIRRQISTRKSVQEGAPDRISDLLEEAANELERMQHLEREGPWIVCAAMKIKLSKVNDERELIICSPRHWDTIAHAQFNQIDDSFYKSKEAQGFVDQFGNFYDRAEAFEIAEKNGQIVKKSGNPSSKILFSEDLY